MKILLIGEYFSENLGDPLLCQTVEKIIKDAHPNAEVIPFDMSGRIGYDSFYQLEHFGFVTKLLLILSQKLPLLFSKNTFYRAFRANEHRYLRVWCSLNNLLKEHTFDLAVFAGGSLFMDYFSGIIYMIVKRLNYARTKIIFHACGMSRLDADAEYLLKRALRKKNILSISLRDSYSKFCELFSTPAEIIDTYDTALGCSNYYDSVCACGADYGIGVIANNSFYEHQKNLIGQLLNSTLSWKIFTNGSRHDMVFAKKILAECGIEEKQLDDYLVARPESSDDLVHTVTQFKRIISFRMHSQIVAASFGIPCFGFAWDNKVVDFFQKLELPQNYSSTEVNLSEIQHIVECDMSFVRLTALSQAEASRLCLVESISKAIRMSSEE